MADWSALVKGFQGGAEFAQDFRSRRQLEKAREFSLKGMGRNEFDLQQNSLEGADLWKQETGEDVALYSGMDEELGDPMGMRLIQWAKTKFGKGKKKQALDTGSITPTESVSAESSAGDEEYDEFRGYADGGIAERKDKREPMSDKERTRYRQNSAGANEAAPQRSLRDKINLKPVEGSGKLATAGRTLARGAAKTGAAAALIAPLANQTEQDIDERYAERFGWEDPTTDVGQDPSIGGFAKFLGKRAIGYASDVGDAATFGLASRFYKDKQNAGAPAQALPTEEVATAPAAPQRMALDTMKVSARPPQQRQAVSQEPQTVDFGQLDIDAHEVPDMKMADWKKYRAQAIKSGIRRGLPMADAVAQSDERITTMQMKGFMNYAQQGFALQQAGNTRGATAAYRAAFQYFPNGNDVEFGIDKKGRIIGVGVDEESGKPVPGTEMVMDPERVAVLMENFKNPQAFRMWTKDWRDFKQDQREYAEVKKPLAQAQATALGNNSEANILRAELAETKAAQGTGGAESMRNAERVFRERVQGLGLEDEAQADYLASVMSRVKAANPNVPDNAIVQAIMTASQDGSLPKRLQQMGIK